MMSSIFSPYYNNWLYSNPMSLTSPLSSSGRTAGLATTTNPYYPSTSYDVQISGLAQLLSNASNFVTALRNLEQPSSQFQTSASSTNTAILTAATDGYATPATYSVTVNSLAQAQTQSNSTGLASATSNTGIGSNSTLTLAPKDGSSNVSTLNLSFTSSDTLTTIAQSINNAGKGYSANVVQDGSNGYYLSITSTLTGKNNMFTVDVTGDLLASSGGFATTQNASDASLSVNGVTQTSASNSGITLANGLTINAIQAGSSQVTVNESSTGLNDGAQKLVNAYNTFTSSLNSALVPGGVLYSDPVVSQLAQSLGQLATSSFSNGSSSITNLTQLGITYQPSQSGFGAGTLSYNGNALQYAYAQDSAGTSSLLQKAVSSFDRLVSQYTTNPGTLPQTLSALKQQAFSDSLSSPPTLDATLIPGTPANLALYQPKNSPYYGNAQQIGSVQQYASLFALQAPYLFNNALVGSQFSLFV